MTDVASALARSLADAGIPVVGSERGATASHAFAIDAAAHGGGRAGALHLRRANLLASAIGLPEDAGAGIRIGVNEIVRRGVTVHDTAELADLVARALVSRRPEALAAETTAFRGRFVDVRFAR